MRRIMINPERLGGVAEIAAELSSPVTNVTTWMSRRPSNRFPMPLRQCGMGGVYDLDEIRTWGLSRGIITQDDELVSAHAS